VIFDGKGSFIAPFTIFYKRKGYFFDDFRLGFMVVEVKVGLLCDF